MEVPQIKKRKFGGIHQLTILQGFLHLRKIQATVVDYIKKAPPLAAFASRRSFSMYGKRNNTAA